MSARMPLVASSRYHHASRLCLSQDARSREDHHLGVATPDKPYALTYIRENGIEKTVEIEVTAFKAPVVESLEQLGVSVRKVTEADHHVPAGVKGIYVSGVTKDSPADRAGLQVGDVINAINNELAKSKHVCDKLVHESKGRARLLVYRYGVAIPVIIES